MNVLVQIWNTQSDQQRAAEHKTLKYTLNIAAMGGKTWPLWLILTLLGTKTFYYYFRYNYTFTEKLADLLFWSNDVVLIDFLEIIMRILQSFSIWINSTYYFKGWGDICFLLCQQIPWSFMDLEVKKSAEALNICWYLNLFIIIIDLFNSYVFHFLFTFFCI